MQMYVFLPLLFVVARKRGAVSILAITAIVTALAAIKPWGLLMFAPCFLPGIVGYTLWGRGKRLSWYLWPPGLALLIFIYSISTHHTFAGPRWPEWTACLAAGILVTRFEEMPGNLLRKVCGFLAKYSYGIYLTHMACLWFATQVT